MKTLNIGLVGYGFMGRTHSNAFSQVNHFFPELGYRPVLKAVCARNAERAEGFAKQWGYEQVVTDWRKLVESPEIDVIDIASPNDTHHDIAIAAAQNGKMVMCEEAARPQRRRGGSDGSGRGIRRGAELRLVQLSARARRHSREADDR